MKHTQGTWKARGRNVWSDNGRFICVVPISGAKVSEICEIEEAEANARLIASAPAMLEALRELVRADDIKKGRSAIKLRIELARHIIDTIEDGEI